MAYVIEVKGLTKKFGDLVAVNGISFNVEYGEIFGLIQTFVNLPLFFLSGALFPVTDIPAWLLWAFYVNPLTYGVDALRSIILGGAWAPLFPLYQEILILLAFDAAMILIGTYAFSRPS